MLGKVNGTVWIEYRSDQMKLSKKKKWKKKDEIGKGGRRVKIWLDMLNIALV